MIPQGYGSLKPLPLGRGFSYCNRQCPHDAQPCLWDPRGHEDAMPWHGVCGLDGWALPSLPSRHKPLLIPLVSAPPGLATTT